LPLLKPSSIENAITQLLVASANGNFSNTSFHYCLDVNGIAIPGSIALK